MRFYWVVSIGAGVILTHHSRVECFVKETLLLKRQTPSSLLVLQNHGLRNEDPMYPQLPSTFDLTLPASLRGEAVRSAIRTHSSGVCFDFSSLTMPQCNVGGVVVSGEGTARFLEGKLTQSFSDPGVHDNLDTSSSVFGDDLVVQRGHVNEACLLSSKGHIIDIITVLSLAKHGSSSHQINEALLLTSPGHSGSALFDRLDPYIFPFDGVKLVDLKVSHPMYPLYQDQRKRYKTRVFTVAASKAAVAYDTVERLLTPIFIKECNARKGSKLPMPAEDSDEFIRLSFTRSSQIPLDATARSNVQINILPQTLLPSCICKGLTFVITESNCDNHSDDAFTDSVWNALTNPINGDGPIPLGPLEWDTLRIESGFPGFGTEMTGEYSGTAVEPDLAELDIDNIDPNTADFGNDNSQPKPKPLSNSLETYYSLLSNRESIGVRASPLELKLDKLIDLNKGCYQGQEQIAAILKNKRGAPRTLYSVSFSDDDNFYDESSSEYEDYSKGRLENQTKPPKVGDALYVLGSNEQIYVGRITSVAERSGTSRPETVAMALVRRFDSIISAMNNIDLDTNFDQNISELENEYDDVYEMPEIDGSGILPPPSLDPLGGLEVCIGGTYTRGLLKVVNWRRLSNWQNLFEKELSNALIDNSDQSGASSVMGYIPQNRGLDYGDRENSANKSKEMVTTDEEIKRAIEDAEAAAKLAEAAVAEAKRKAERIESLKNQAAQQSLNKDAENVSPTLSDSQRKAEKMDMLKRQAEAALERRRQQNDKK